MATRTQHLQDWIHSKTQAAATDAVIALGAHLRTERYVEGTTPPYGDDPDHWESVPYYTMPRHIRELHDAMADLDAWEAWGND